MEAAKSEEDLVSLLHENLAKQFCALDEKALSKCDRVFRFHVPSLTRDLSDFPNERFRYVGRSWFQELYDFATGLMKPKPAEDQPSSSKRVKPNEEQQKRRDKLLEWERSLESTLTLGELDKSLGSAAYIIGTPGEGKTYGVAVLAGLLHVKGGDFVTVYISAKRFVLTPYVVLRSALLLAFCTQPHVVATLKGFTDEQSLLDWVATTKKLLFLVDDYNELDDERRKGSTGTQAQRERVRSMLDVFTLRHVVVYCCSCSSKCRLPLTRDPHPPYMLIAGGFSKEEFETFVLVENTTIADENLWQTGRNPRLLRLLLGGELDQALKQLENDMEVFLNGLSAVEISELMSQLAGRSPITRLPQAMDSRCFFPNDGALVAISDYLLSVVYSRCVQLCRAAAEQTPGRDNWVLCCCHPERRCKEYGQDRVELRGGYSASSQQPGRRYYSHRKEALEV